MAPHPAMHGGGEKSLLAMLYVEVQRQASMLAFNDAFIFLSITTALLVLLAPLFRRPAGGGPPPAGMGH